MVHANWTRIACVTSGCLPAVHGQSVSLFCGCHFIVEFASDLPTRRTRAGACWSDAPRFSHLRGTCATASSTSLRTCVRRARRLEPGCSPPPPNSHAPGASRAPSLRAQRLCLSGCTPPPPRRTSCRPLCLLPPTRGPAWPTVPGALRRADRTCHGVGPPSELGTPLTNAGFVTRSFVKRMRYECAFVWPFVRCTFVCVAFVIRKSIVWAA